MPPNWAEAVPAPRTSTSKQINIILFMASCAFLPSEVGRHGVIVVIRQREVARKINFDSMAFADSDRRHDVQEFVEYLSRGLRGALSKSLAHEVAAGGGESSTRASFGHRSQRANGKGETEDAKVVVVDLVA